MDLSDIRRQYGATELHKEDLNPNPVEQFSAWLSHAIESELFTDPTAVNLATVSESGYPSQRVVLLKEYDDEGFVFYTNLESNKAKHIESNPNVCLHFAWLGLERQVIIQGHAEKLSVSEAARYFLTRPHNSQLAAWASQQSRPVLGRKMLEQAFEQMKSRFSKGEVPLPSFWGGYRVKPVSIEFWQGRVNRLHDRFMYRLENDNWIIERLQP